MAKAVKGDPIYVKLVNKVDFRISNLNSCLAPSAASKNYRSLLYAMHDLLESEKSPTSDLSQNDPVNSPTADEKRMLAFLERCKLEVLTSEEVRSDCDIWFLLRDILDYFDQQTVLRLPEKNFDKLEVRLGTHILRQRETFRVEGFITGQHANLRDIFEHEAKLQKRGDGSQGKKGDDQSGAPSDGTKATISLPPTFATFPPSSSVTNAAAALPADTASGSRLVDKYGTRETPRNPFATRSGRSPSENAAEAESHGVGTATASRSDQPNPDDDGGEEDDGDDFRGRRDGGFSSFGRGRSAKRFQNVRDEGGVSTYISSSFEKHYAHGDRAFSGDLVQPPSFAHWVVGFESLLELNGVKDERSKVMLLSTAVTSMASTFYISDIRGDPNGRLHSQWPQNAVPARTFPEAIHRLESQFCSSTARSALRTTLQAKKLREFQVEEDLPYVQAVAKFADFIQRYSLNGPDTYKSEQAMVDTFVEALEPEEWTRTLIARVKAFRHQFTLAEFASSLQSLAQATASTSERFFIGKPSQQSTRRSAAKVFLAQTDSGDRNEHAGEEGSILHEPTAAAFLESVVQSGVHFSEDGAYTIARDGHAIFYGDTRSAPRQSRSTFNSRARSHARIRPAPTPYPSTLPLFQAPRPERLPSTAPQTTFQPRLPAAPVRQNDGSCFNCGQFGHLYLKCPQARRGLGQALPQQQRLLERVHMLQAENAMLSDAYFAKSSAAASSKAPQVVPPDESTQPTVEETLEEDLASGREAFANYFNRTDEHSATTHQNFH